MDGDLIGSWAPGPITVGCSFLASVVEVNGSVAFVQDC